MANSLSKAGEKEFQKYADDTSKVLAVVGIVAGPILGAKACVGSPAVCTEIIVAVSEALFIEGPSALIAGKLTITVSEEIIDAAVKLKKAGKGEDAVKLVANNITNSNKLTNISAGKGASGSLTGQPTKLPPNASAENIRALTRENEGAKILSQNGFNVEQNPKISGLKNPDYKINGEIFDNYAPSSSNIRNIWREVDKKVQKGQTNSVVINLADSKATVGDVQKQFNDWPVKGLDKVIVIDQSGKATRIK